MKKQQNCHFLASKDLTKNEHYNLLTQHQNYLSLLWLRNLSTNSIHFSYSTSGSVQCISSWKIRESDNRKHKMSHCSQNTSLKISILNHRHLKLFCWNSKSFTNVSQNLHANDKTGISPVFFAFLQTQSTSMDSTSSSYIFPLFLIRGAPMVVMAVETLLPHCLGVS